jgi:hypothetical protein
MAPALASLRAARRGGRDQSTSRAQNLTVRNPLPLAIFSFGDLPGDLGWPAIFAAAAAHRPGFPWATDAVRKARCFL